MRKLFDSISKSIPINQFSLVQNQYQYQYANKEENEIKIEIETDIFDLKSRMNSKPMFLARPWVTLLVINIFAWYHSMTLSILFGAPPK